MTEREMRLRFEPKTVEAMCLRCKKEHSSEYKKDMIPNKFWTWVDTHECKKEKKK